MQRAAVVGVMPALIVVMMSGPSAALMMHVLMLSVGCDRVRERFRTRERRRHHPSKLGDQKQGDQHADKAT